MPVVSIATRGRLAAAAVFAATLLSPVFRVSPVNAAETATRDPWIRSFDEALRLASSSGKPILAIFTGSDWCPHCHTLAENVLSTPTFLTWSKDRFVLLEIDLPQEGISREERLARSRVCLTYGVRSFPSVVIIGGDGAKIFGHSGYSDESASAWIEMVASHLPALGMDQSLAAAENTGETADRQGIPGVHASLGTAVESARESNRPVLLLVSRSANTSASSQSQALLSDPEFMALASEHFVVATVPPDAQEDPDAEAVGRLLGGATLADDAVELVVTMDGRTPVFSQSGRQPVSRVVNGLRRFLLARASARTGNQLR